MQKEEYADNCFKSKRVYTEEELLKATSKYYGEIEAKGNFVKKIHENQARNYEKLSKKEVLLKFPFIAYLADFKWAFAFEG